MLKLILGRAKRGKTAAVTEAIRKRVEQGLGNTLLLVPEQYSHEAEMELLRVCGDRMSLYAEVLSFTRLALRVEAELGGSARQTLDQGGRLLCLVRAVGEVHSRLEVYAAARRQTALQQKLLQAIDECKTCRITPEALRALADTRVENGRTDALGDKLRELALLYDAYEAIAARSGLDPLDRLTVLAQRVSESRYAAGAVWIDGFTDFTAQESAVIEALLRRGVPVTVCLTAEGTEESYEIFEPSRRAAVKLLRLAQSLGVETETVYLTGEFRQSPMAVVERELFGFGAVTADAGGAVELLRAGSLNEECEAAAARCLRLVQDTGCRWRDVAVTARNFDAYQGVLESVFERYGVPLYAAVKSDLSEKPLYTLIAAAYAAVTGYWAQDDVMTLCKTGLVGLNRGECDTLENYVFLHSLHGVDWTRNGDWQRHPRGFGLEFSPEDTALLAEINGLRRRVTEPLLVLYHGSREAVTARGQAEALAAFFDALQLPELLRRRAAELKERGMAQTAAEYAQLWGLTVRALEQCAAVLGETEMDAETFGSLFLTVLGAYDVGSIPMRLDRVSAGDMQRMRRRHIRHLIVLGCDSESVPAAAGDVGIFSDDDRETLRSAGMELGSTAGERLDREFALLYQCLTLPEETLSMSWNAAGSEEGEAKPAFVIRRAKELFGLNVRPVDPDACRAMAVQPAFELAAAAERGADTPLRRAALAYMAAGDRAAELEAIRTAAALSRGKLSRQAVRSLYGERPRLSASGAEKLASCPFAFFLQYGLRAKPRQKAEFAKPDFGTFIHYVLEHTARDVQAQGGFAGVERATVEALCDQYVEAYVREKLNDFREQSARFVYLFRRLKSQVRTIVLDMAEELACGDFVPLDFELDFSDRSAFPPIQIGDGDGSLTLTGKADRVDGYYHDGRLYLRVVDYKTGKKDFSLSDVWYGMGLQMLLYLFSLERGGSAHYDGREIVPAGVLYVPARDTLLSASVALSPEEILRKKTEAHRRKGLVLDDDEILRAMERGEIPKYLPFKVKTAKGGSVSRSAEGLATAEQLGQLARHVDLTLQKLSRELHSGSVAADPWYQEQTTSCTYCDYAAACHFDETKDHIRYMTRLKDAEVWQKIAGEEEA